MNNKYFIIPMLLMLMVAPVLGASTFRIALTGANVDINATKITGTHLEYADLLNAPTIINYTSYIDTLNLTKLNITDQRYNDTGYCSALVSSVGNWSNDKSSYNTTVQLKTYFDTLYYPLIGNPSGFLTAVPSTYALKSDIVGLVGNWSLDKSSYNTTAQLNNLYYPLTGNPSGFLTTFTETDPIASPRVDSLNLTKASIGNCGAGQVVQNTTTSGVECVTPTSASNVNGTSINVTGLILNNTDVDALLMTRYNEFSYLRMLEDDQCGVQTTSGEMWYGTAISSGTTTTSTGYMTHPCVRALRSSTTASSGYCLNLGATNLLLNGSETTDVIFMKPAISGNITNAVLGFVDSVTATASVDGAYIEILNNTIIGRVRNNNFQYNTSTNTTITFAEWYRARIEVINSTTAIFYLYNSTTSTGTGNTGLVWSSTLTGVLPMATSRQTGHGVCVWKSGGTTAQDILYLDYMNVKIDRMLSR